MSRPRKIGPILILFLVLFVVSVGFGLVIPILPLIARDFGASAFMLGAMTAGYAVVQFLFSPIWGQISDRIGRKPVLMIGTVGLGISFFLMGLSSTFTGLFLARVLGGFLGSATLPAAQALVAEVSGNRDRASAMGLMGAAFGTGFIFGPVIGGLLAPLGVSVPFFAAGGFTLITILLSALLLKEPDNAEIRRAQLEKQDSETLLQKMGIALKGPGNPFYLLAFAIMFSQGCMMTALALYLTDSFGVTASTIGIIFAANGAIGAMIQGAAIGPITRRIGENSTIATGLLFGIAGFLGLVSVGSLGWAVPAIMLTAVAMSLSRPSITSMLSKVTPLPQGVTMGLQSSFDSLGRVVGPLWAGFAYDTAMGLPFVSAAVMYGLALVYFRYYQKRVPSIKSPVPEEGQPAK